MNESEQNKRPKWRRRLEQSVASVMVVAAAGCAKAPEEELPDVAANAVESCKNPGRYGKGRSRTTTTGGIVSLSIPCEMADDKAAIEREIANAVKVCRTAQPGETEIYLGQNYKGKDGVVASCTLAGKNPLMAADSAAPSASSPLPRVRRSIYSEAYAPAEADSAASAPAPKPREQGSFLDRMEQGAKSAQPER